MEGIMGHRAMRLRFLDMEPEEVFALARNGGPNKADVTRCRDFVRLWHKALAAGTATQIYMEAPASSSSPASTPASSTSPCSRTTSTRWSR